MLRAGIVAFRQMSSEPFGLTSKRRIFLRTRLTISVSRHRLRAAKRQTYFARLLPGKNRGQSKTLLQRHSQTYEVSLIRHRWKKRSNAYWHLKQERMRLLILETRSSSQPLSLLMASPSCFIIFEGERSGYPRRLNAGVTQKHGRKSEVYRCYVKRSWGLLLCRYCSQIWKGASTGVCS